MKQLMQNKILLFDLGNILVQLNSVDSLFKKEGQKEMLIDLFWSESKAVRDYESGRISSLKDFYKALKKEKPSVVSEFLFYDLFCKIIGDVFPNTRSLLSKLKDQYPLFLLSNTNETHWAVCRYNHQLDKYFNGVFLSYEMGAMKPDPMAFQMAIHAIGCNPQNIWYYDDRKENVKEALKQGINAYKSFGGDPLINDLRKHGFLLEAL